MKKIALFVCAVAVSMALTSCQALQKIASNENVSNIVKTVVNTYITPQGTTYNYKGTVATQLMKKTSDGYVFVEANGKTTSSTITMPLVAGTTGTITLPAMTVDGATMSQVQVGTLTVATSGTTSTLTVGDSTTAAGTLTVDGTSYNISGVYLENCTYTTSAFTGKTMQIYFGTSNEYVVSMSFTGTI